MNVRVIFEQREAYSCFLNVLFSVVASIRKQSNLLERWFCLQCAAMHREVKTTEKPCDTRVLQITQHEKALNALN